MDGAYHAGEDLSMKIALRCDASVAIGTGHVMRCLTLARALRDARADCHFITRVHSGHLVNRIKAEGFAVAMLAAPQGPAPEGPPVHAPWAGVSWEQDASETRDALVLGKPDWLVVDHYAFDSRWHDAVRPACDRLMVIDDLADRPLSCDLLLDQNLGRKISDYDALVPVECRRLVGPQFALLRPEFRRLRAAGIARRCSASPSRMLVTMGGIDSGNNVGDVLDALCRVELPNGIRVTIVMGSGAPYLAQIGARLHSLPFDAELLVDVDDMAQLMAQCDLAISASGLIVYELACMGVPMLLLPVSDIQRHVAREVARMSKAHVAEDWLSDPVSQVASEIQTWLRDVGTRKSVEPVSSNLINGTGSLQVLRSIIRVNNV